MINHPCDKKSKGWFYYINLKQDQILTYTRNDDILIT